jgi:hypothetical protein
MAVVAAPDAHFRQHAELEAGELRFDAIAPRQQPLDRRHTLVRRGHRRERRGARAVVQSADRDGGARHHGARRIDDRHDQASVLRGLRSLRCLCARTRRGREDDAQQQGATLQ